MTLTYIQNVFLGNKENKNIGGELMRCVDFELKMKFGV